MGVFAVKQVLETELQIQAMQKWKVRLRIQASPKAATRSYSRIKMYREVR